MHDDFEKLSELREEMFERILIANKAAYLVELPWGASLEDILRTFEAEEGGVWCAGAAFVLFKAYVERGLDAYSYFYGFPGGFTHVTTLVRIRDDLYLHDAYLNFAYAEPFFDLLREVADGRPPRAVIGRARRRPVLAAAVNTLGWFREGEGSSPWRDSRPGFRIYSAEMSLPTLHEKYREPDLGEALDRVEAEGLPRDLTSLLLYPFGLTGSEGWVDDPASDLNGGLYGRIVAQCEGLRAHALRRLAG
jgi:hypothetical protein